MKCPSCKNGIRGVPLIVHPTWIMTDEELQKAWDFISKCDRCNGTGEVSEESAEWIERGKQMKQARLSMRIGMRQSAEVYGIDPLIVSQMERGIVKPDLTLLDKLKGDK